MPMVDVSLFPWRFREVRHGSCVSVSPDNSVIWLAWRGWGGECVWLVYRVCGVCGGGGVVSVCVCVCVCVECVRVLTG